MILTVLKIVGAIVLIGVVLLVVFLLVLSFYIRRGFRNVREQSDPFWNDPFWNEHDGGFLKSLADSRYANN